MRGSCAQRKFAVARGAAPRRRHQDTRFPFSDHQWLVAIADVVRVEAPLPGRARLDKERRLGPLDDDDSLHFVEDEEVAGAQDRAARKAKTERQRLRGLCPRRKLLKTEKMLHRSPS